MDSTMPPELVTADAAAPVVPDTMEELLRQFVTELPWHIRCTPQVAVTSMYSVRAFLRAQSEPFPACFDYARVFVWLQHLASTPPRNRDKPKREAGAINSHLKSLKRFGKWAVARGFITVDPTVKLKLQRPAERIILAPDDKTMLALYNSLEGFGRTAEVRTRNYALICFMLDAGPRANEVLLMRVDDVLDDDGNVRDTCVLHGKGNKDRIVALNPAVRAALERYIMLRRPAQGESRLWVNDVGYGMTYPALREVLQRLCLRAGVKVALHDFRRFALTKMWLTHIDQVSGMAISGHKSAEVYIRYIRGAIMQRAVADHVQHSPLARLLEQAQQQEAASG